MKTAERLKLLAACVDAFAPWTGSFTEAQLLSWLAAEMGHPEALDRPVPHGSIQSRAVVRDPLLHVTSANTPHAAMQTLLRGLVVGARNTLKLPSTGMEAVEQVVAGLPEELRRSVCLVQELPRFWARDHPTVVVFGNDETIQWFKENTPATTRLLPHGQKIGMGLVSGDLHEAARLAARDASLHDQQGCLSLHDVYVKGGPQPAREFASLLAAEMELFEQDPAHSKEKRSLQQSAAIASLRESVRFSAASNPETCALWESENSNAWTVIYEQAPVLKIGPLNRVVYVKPWPGPDCAALGPATAHLSTLALHPFDHSPEEGLLHLGATRLCAMGRAQEPSLFWHHDGFPALGSLVDWVDIDVG